MARMQGRADAISPATIQTVIKAASASDSLKEESQLARARMMLERARWAAAAFARLDREATLRIAKAAADAGFAKAQLYADWAVKETGFGVAEHKKIKNELCSRGIFEHYRNEQLAGLKIDADRKIVELARPAGVVFALTPSTNPVSTVFFKIMIALLGRNAIIISPHPMAKACCVDAARCMADAAAAAGAPDGTVQVIEEPSIPLISALMSDPRTDVILATGGTPMVRAAYSSGNPAIGVGPSNVPVLVDATADLAKAAKRIVASKSFDNSVLCTNESVLIAEAAIADKLLRHMQGEGAYLCSEEETERLRAYLFPGDKFNLKALGRDATTIAAEAGIRAPGKTRILLAPFDLPVPEEPFAREKLCPVLGFLKVPNAQRGIEAARALLRYSGGGHSAAIHSKDPRTILAFTAAVNVLRVAVNVPCSQGAAGFDTNLAPTMTIGTGFFGRSSIGENVGPQHLVNWTRIAYNKEASEAFGDYSGLEPWDVQAPDGTEGLELPMARTGRGDDELGEMRDEIRKVIIEELRSLFMGS
ncbi:MAG TPA: aldehyde dehydrogenase family protein [Hypericibacter adhaerens]|uniref:aldehyde dehydrogenase family protein n=1 Tax=Hypericibacter adhaerens TaxID=2602016 RepID=UPI002C3B11D2|nr:aldehyde dehydrogenase family protein [Hypericibacter adhaerens]HWA41911.1 aldehyde dehydrogenase family protein [Hypericibacter adhaerens]